MRTATLTRTARGPSPLPRRRVNPSFRNAVRDSGLSGRRLAYEAGLNFRSVLSKLANAQEVPDTPLQIARLERIADVIGFDPARLFLPGGDK